MSDPRSSLSDMWNAILASNPNVSAPTTVPTPAPPPAGGTPRTLGEVWSNALAARGIAPPAPAPAPPPPATVDEALAANPNFSAPTTAPTTSTKGPLAAGYVPLGAPKSAEEVADEAYRARQAASYLPKAERSGAAAPAPAAPVTTGNKYAAGGAGGASSAPTDINWNRASGGTATIPAHEQPVVAEPRQKQLTGAIESQKGAASESADAAADIETAKAQGARDLAKQYEDAGVDAKLRAQTAADEMKAFRSKIDDFSAKVAKDKINPNRMWEDASTGQKIAWTMAKGLGAIQQGFLHLSSNQIADSIDGMVAQDVAAQRANHEIGRERLADMNTFYGHALRESATAEEAERVATGYALEAAKQQAQAMTLSAGSAAQKAKGKEVVALLDEKLAEKGIVMNPLVQARTVSTGPSIAKLGEDMDAYRKEMAGYGKIVTPDEAFQYAIKKNTMVNPLSTPINQGAKLEGANKELKETQTATDEFNKQMDALANHPVIVGSGLGTAAGAKLPARLAPESNDAQQQLEAINTRNLQAIGKVAKDADGKPNKEMIKKIEERFEIHLSDPPAIKQQKLQGVRDVYNALARQQGAKSPALSGTAPPPTFEK